MRDVGGKRSKTRGEDQRAAAVPKPGIHTLTEILPPETAAVQRKAAQSAPVPAMPSGPRPTIQDLFGGMQHKEAGDGPTNGTAPAAVVQRKADGLGTAGETQMASSSGGQPMAAPVRAKMERAFGVDFSAVRIHEGNQATAIGALGYTQGTDIHFSPGQYQPDTPRGQELLGHELAHVVQQSQGRVSATGQAKGLAINDDTGLEHEADEMGARAARGESVHGGSAPASATSMSTVQRKVIQRKDVATHFGTFRTTKFQKVGTTGVDCVLTFDPDQDKIEAKKIGLSQSVKITYPDGGHTGIDPTKEGRRVKGGAGSDYVLDRISTKNNPVYGAPDVAPGEGLDKTAADNNRSAAATKVGPAAEGGNATFQLGYAYTEGNAKKKREAALYDQPSGGGGNMFETAAMALEGADKGKYFGSVKWGYEAKLGDVEIKDIELASMGVPTQNYLAALELWNNTKTRGTLEVIANPAKARRVDMTEVDVAKGTKAKQLAEGALAGKPVVKVETLDEHGTGTGKEFYIYVVDLKDTQNGSATVKGAVPKVFTNPAQATLFSNPERTLKVKDLPARSRMVETGSPKLTAQHDHDRIARLAHTLWEQRGKPDGSQDVDWVHAEAIVRDSEEVKLVDGPDLGLTGHVDQTQIKHE